MVSPNFASILSERPTEVERPKNLPAGTYLCIVGQWETGQSSKKKTDFVKFDLKPVSAMDDVDAAELEAVGGVADRALSITFYMTDDAKFMLDQFHANCGCDLAGDGLDRGQRNDEVLNAEVLAVLEHEIDERDPSRVYARVRSTAIAS